MVKNKILLLGMLFLCMLCGVQEAAAQGNTAHKDTKQQTDAEVITVRSSDLLPYVDPPIGLESCEYLFTKKLAGKTIPLRADADGVMWYCFSSDKMELLDENGRSICGKADDQTLGWAFIKLPEDHSADYYYPEHIYGKPVRLLPVKKGKTYYVRFPAVFSEETCGISAYVFPKNIKKIPCGISIKDTYEKDFGKRAYLSEGTGKYQYYHFTNKKKCVAYVCVNPLFTENIEEKTYFRVQKKVNGKWKDVTSIRISYANYQHGNLFEYALSKGKYRLGVKAKKGQVVEIHPIATSNVKYKNPTKKSKAPLVKKGKKKDGIFVWEDTKAHWYKVVKTSKNKVKKLELQTGTVKDKTRFTIYKEGQASPCKEICFRGRDRYDGESWRRKRTYTLKDNGIYYIRVSKTNKKATGAYRIKVK